MRCASREILANILKCPNKQSAKSMQRLETLNTQIDWRPSTLESMAADLVSKPQAEPVSHTGAEEACFGGATAPPPPKFFKTSIRASLMIYVKTKYSL